MRNFIIIAAATLALAGCGDKSRPAASGSPASGAQAANDAAPSAEQLSAQATKDEAEANRLLAQVNAQNQGAAPPVAAPRPSGAALGPNSQKLHSGQYYETINFNAVAGKTYMVTYDTQGYRPALIVLDGANQMFSQSSSTQQGQTSYHLEAEIKPESSGNWHVLLSEADVGATGSFTVNLQEIHETALH